MTKLAPLSDLIPTTKDFTTALGKFYAGAAHNLGGHLQRRHVLVPAGNSTGACSCAAGAYLETDGNCYPTCENTATATDAALAHANATASASARLP